MTFKAVGYRAIGMIIALFLVILCNACGESSSERALGIDGYVYRPKLLFSLTGKNYRIRKLREWNNSLYYIWKSTLYRLPVKDEIDFSESRAVLEIPPEGLVDYVIGVEQELYYVVGEEKVWDAKTVSRGCTLIKCLENGKTVYSRFLPDDVAGGESCLGVNQQGWVFLALTDGIYCIDPEGNLSDIIKTGEIRVQGMEEKLLQGAEGKLYYCVETSYSQYSFYEIVGNNSFQLEKRDELPEEVVGIYSSKYGLMCDTRDGTLYQYSMDGSRWKALLKWGDTDMYRPIINSNQIVQISADEIITYFYADMGREGTEEMNLLTRMEVTELPEREEIVMAALYPSSELMQLVSEFNRASNRYHVTVELYSGGEVETKLNSRLVASNPPDLLETSQLDILNYAEKKTFEDLVPYLEKSSLLNREDFLKNLLEGYTVDGRLVCIPRCFGVNVTTGKTSLIGEEAGWTVEEFIEKAEKNPGLVVTDYDSRESMLREMFKQYLCSNYIDWDTGECWFDSEEFCHFLKWVKHADVVMGEGQAENSYWTEERLVTRPKMQWMADCAGMETLFGESVTFKGDPTGDGDIYFPVVPMDVVSIISGSKHKEGAWEFLEFILSHDAINSRGFPSRWDMLMEMMEEEMTPEYLQTQDGEVLMWLGEPQLKQKLRYGPESTPYYFMTQEQADALLEVLEELDFTPTGGIKDKIVEIIIEESRSYMEGDRSVNEVAQYIQSRVGTLVQENR